jgi:His-Xaa-Ser system radical SAM maturase HxsC
MITLLLPAVAEADTPFVTKLSKVADGAGTSSTAVAESPEAISFAGEHGLLTISGACSAELDGDIVLVEPRAGTAERLIRAGSAHNTLLATERCDQLCLMCSQPPKKHHVDRFAFFEQACLLAEPNSFIGISGGEPTLYKAELLGLIERVLTAREDMQFHVLTNGQHFDAADIERLRQPCFRRVTWGIPLYASQPDLHDRIVGKLGAFSRLEASFAALLLSGARIELRTVLLADNCGALESLSQHVTSRLRFVESWSIMQLENIGFAKNRWHALYVDHRGRFEELGGAIDRALLYGVDVRLFNFPRCSVPPEFRHLAEPSISDWKRKFAPACNTCSQQELCSGFFEWHPDEQMAGVVPL